MDKWVSLVSEVYYELESIKERLTWLEDHLTDSPSWSDLNDLKALVDDLRERMESIEVRLARIERVLLAKVRV